MFSRVYSGGLSGVNAYRVEVEVDSCGGIGQLSIVGLPDAAVKESQERVRAAIRSCDVLLPPGRKWVINLAPADTKKEGPSLDLPIAVAVLASAGSITQDKLTDFWIAGELGLDGAVRPVAGVLPLAMSCRESGATGLIIPQSNAREAELVDGLNIVPVGHLKEVVDILSTAKTLRTGAHQNKRQFITKLLAEKDPTAPDFKDVKGQHSAKRAMMIAAAGRHNLIMVGPPGSGKSMLAQRICSILPPLEYEEALELTKLYSVAGMLDAGTTGETTIVKKRPFRSPHHSASLAGLVGGGSSPRPGEISLAHLGVLFLDELTEFSRHHLEALRQPLETGTVTISRAQFSYTYPASFILIGACNPCPCGYRGDTIKHCTCTQPQAERYWSKLSGPILDRIDLLVLAGRLSETELTSPSQTESSESMSLKVQRAVSMQRERQDGKFVFNSQLSPDKLKRFARVPEEGRKLLAGAVIRMGLSARAYDRVVRIARTIADLEGKDDMETIHIAEALRYRSTGQWI